MKRKSLSLLFLLFLSMDIYGASLKFAKEMNYETDYKKALAKAKLSDKPIMMVVSTKTCPWCRKLERQTLKKDMVNDTVSKLFIPLTVTRDIDKYPGDFNAKVVPTVFFIDPKTEKTFDISYGYKNKKVFAGIVKKAAEEYKIK